MKKRQRNINNRSSHELASILSSKENEPSSSFTHWSFEDSQFPTRILVSTAGGREEENEEVMLTRASCLSYGSISVMGRQRMMKDAFFAVYDGHGDSSVSNACRNRLHLLLAQEVELWKRGGKGVVDWEKVMASCFTKMDEEVGGGVGYDTEGNWMNTVGSSTVVVIVGQNELVVANSGNSSAVLCRGGVAIPLSRKVINWYACRVLGVLSTSRSIGYHYLKPYVISEPEVTISKRTDDGLWDVVSNEGKCQVVGRCLDAQKKRRSSEGMSRTTAAANAAALLAQLALARGSKDKITVIVVELNKSSA
ncbi:unnamed protein product [Malus baccata var. baccata]